MDECEKGGAAQRIWGRSSEGALPQMCQCWTMEKSEKVKRGGGLGLRIALPLAFSDSDAENEGISADVICFLLGRMRA